MVTLPIWCISVKNNASLRTGGGDGQVWCPPSLLENKAGAGRWRPGEPQGHWDVGMSHGTVRPAEVWACPHSSIIPTHPIHPGEGAVGRMSARVQLQFLLSTLNSPPEKG